MAELSGSCRVTPKRDVGAPQLISLGTTVLVLASVINTIAAVQFLQIFDAVQASDVTLGTTNPDLELQVPASGAANLQLDKGVRFMKGIVIASTTAEKGAVPSAAGVQVFPGWF